MQDAADTGATAPSEQWHTPLLTAVGIGVLCICVYAFQFLTSGLTPSIMTVGLLVAGAAFLLGALVGFLFGIPRSLQQDRPPSAGSGATAGDRDGAGSIEYRPNTNLEQISDWLTKILVGVGLTQLTAFPDKFAQLSGTVGAALGGSTVGPRFAGAAMLYFGTGGFLYGYLWTRLYLARLLRGADLAAQIATLTRQPQVDATALSITNRQLTLDPLTPPVPVDELKKAIKGASPSIKIQIFYLAQKVRSESWQTNKPLMERTIPIFEALVESDPDKRFHRNYGQLGYALKDQRAPKWAEAEAALTTAIQIRDATHDDGWRFYEYNRAICRVRRDPSFPRTASAPETKAAILADLREGARTEVLDFLRQPPINEWMTLNGVTESDVSTPARP